MKKVIILSSIAIIIMGFYIQTVPLDPTGTYQLNLTSKGEDGEVYGYSGQIQVKKLGNDNIAMTFYVNKGAPSYNSGSFVDTLIFRDNNAIHTDPEADSTCKITFEFANNGVMVKEETADFNWGCGFGHAVVADGFYKKISSKIPVLTEPLTGDELKNDTTTH